MEWFRGFVLSVLAAVGHAGEVVWEPTVRVAETLGKRHSMSAVPPTNNGAPGMACFDHNEN